MWSLTCFYISLSVHFTHTSSALVISDYWSVQQPLPLLALLSASHNQILNKSGNRERAYVRGEGRRVPVPLSPYEERASLGPGCNEELILLQICFFLRGRACAVRRPYMSLWDVHVQGCMFCRLLFSLPTGNNLCDSITLQYLSQSHGRPERLSALTSLPLGRMASLFGLCHFSRGDSFPASCQHFVIMQTLRVVRDLFAWVVLFLIGRRTQQLQLWEK